MFLGYPNLPNALTLTGLALAMGAVLLSLSGRVELALIALILSGLLDLFDGVVARKMRLSEAERSFGIQIDSIADMGSFGVAPALIAWGAGASHPWDVALVLLYAGAAATRLAWFNTHTATAAGARVYTGLPVTFAALVMPLAWLAARPAGAQLAAMELSLGVMALLFVSRLPIRKPSGVAYLIFPLLAAGMIAALAVIGG
ncbi:MAG: CDP-alcohol phosphatidyltransferase family protein [Deltaproteobacteria bacterium]|nr:CDP-alcohol phosphatidyltransferase family protein [Deltaproteobacteria bacterium]